MSKREWKICTWIHHLATITGLCTGIINYTQKKSTTWKKNLLLIHIVSQIWAAIKIAASIFPRKDSKGTDGANMQRSYEHIHNLCKNKEKERIWTFVLCGMSVLFKIGIPVLLD